MSDNGADTAQSAQTHGFQTEAKQLLKLMIHSLYSNREIFLRELISNASDAIDKLRLKVLSNPALADAEENAITVSFDAAAGTVTISDNGIGMTRDEVISNLGTIARSGTAEFLAGLSGDEKQDAALIGQFGVGFYSGFIVADEMEVHTRSVEGGAGTRWVSAGEDEFTVDDVDKQGHGTDVILHLREDSKEFADDTRLRHIVRKYSDHIGVPVQMLKPPMPVPEADSEDAEQAESVSAEPELETVNEAKALWTRSRSEVKEDEYKEFYKYVSHDFEDPLTWSHNRVEGKLEYTSLLYVPKRAPFDMWNRDIPRGLKLYVQRVFILDEAEQFLPLYLRFVKGVVDSNDLPLNVSREILQEDARVDSIRNALTKRILTMLGDLAKKEPEQYQTFWDQFGEVLKEGAGEDFANRETLAKLLRFASTSHDDKTVALDDYLARAAEGQDKIYYLVADSQANAKNSPHLEIFKKQGIEVLIMFDRIDEWLMGSLTEFDGKAFQDVMRGELDLPDADKEDDAKDDAETDEALTERMKEALGDAVQEVRRSKRLTDSPACLVMDEQAMGAQMRRIMEASGQSMPESKPILEYNADHPLVQRLDREQDEDRFADLVKLVLDQAALADGSALDDAAAYVGRVNRLLVELLKD